MKLVVLGLLDHVQLYVAVKTPVNSSHDGSDLLVVLEVNIDKSILPIEPSRSYQMWSEFTVMMSIMVESQTMDIPVFLLSVIVFLAAVGAVLALLLRKVVREWEKEVSMQERAPVVVLVEESPPPTRMPSTPSSSVFGTVRRRPKRAGWRGARRRSSHRRRETRRFDPALPNHCGFQCILRAAKRHCGIEAVCELRSQVADQIYEKRVRGMSVCGVDVHHLIAEEGLTLEAYCQRMREDMWASCVELSLAADILGISLIYSDKGKKMKIGHGPLAGVIKRIGSYFVLHNLHADPSRMVRESKEVSMNRAGMLMPRTLPRRSWVKIVPIDPVEIDSVTVNVDTMTVADLKMYLARILRVQMSMIVIVDPDGEAEVPDWTEPPDRLEAYVHNIPPKIKVEISVPQRDATFCLMLPPEATKVDVEEKLSKLLGIIPHFLDIKGEGGGPFVSCAHLPSRKLTVSLYGRGGMRAGHTDEGNEGGDENYDTTLDDPEVQQEDNNLEVAEENYWDHDDDYDPAHEQEVWEEHVNEIMDEPTPRHRERSRSRDGWVQRAHRRGVHWADQGEDMDAYTIWSPVWPRSPPSAQPDRVPKPLVTDGSEIGRIMAAPRALLSQVLAEFAISHKFECLIHVEPMGAVEWRQVESLGVEAPRPRTSYHLDLREGPWERYQSIRHVPVLIEGMPVDTVRHVPVLIEGMPVDTVLFPWHLPIHLAQARLDDDTHVQQNWMVCAVNTDDWVIVRLRIPSSILEDLDDLETYRQEAERIGYRRAGAPLCLTCSSHRPYVSLRVVLAHEPSCVTTYGILRRRTWPGS